MADPLIVHWPRGIAARGEIRHHYVHAVDIAPTVLEVIGVDPPSMVGGVEQRPLDGSASPAFDRPDAADRHTVQYYEMFGCRALYQDGWKAVTYHAIQGEEPGLDAHHGSSTTCEPILGVPRPRRDRSRSVGGDGRSVVGGGRAQRGTAGRQPAVLGAGVRPAIVGRRAVALRLLARPADRPRERRRERAAVRTPSAHVTIGAGAGSVEGVLAVQGSVLGGWSFHLLGDGRPLQPGRLADRPDRGCGARWPVDARRSHPGDAVRAASRRAARRRRGDRRGCGAAHGVEPPVADRGRAHGGVVWRLLSLPTATTGDGSVHGHAAPGGGGVPGTSRWSIQTPRPKRRSAPSSAGPLGQIPA